MAWYIKIIIWNKSNKTHNEYAHIFWFSLHSFISWSWFLARFNLGRSWSFNRSTSWPLRSFSKFSFSFFLSTCILILWSTAPLIRFYSSTRLFPVTLSAISNASSIWLSKLKRSWSMENKFSSWCRMIWARNDFASKHVRWDDYDVTFFALSTCTWR